MIVTDGATETAVNVFETRNWVADNVSTCHPYEVSKKKNFHRNFSFEFVQTRVFTYMIGRELGDPKHIKWMSCANKGSQRGRQINFVSQKIKKSLIFVQGYFAHVSTLEDIQENVEDYIPVTARPIGMYNDHVTVWSSVFLDVERTLPIKTYKWFPFKLADLSISMEEFKNKSKVKLTITHQSQQSNLQFFISLIACQFNDFHRSACSQSAGRRQ